MTEETNANMNKNETKPKNGIVKNNILLRWIDNITVIDLSNKNIAKLDENVKFPPNLIELNISHNNLVDVPNAVIKLELLQILDLSFNRIKYFDESPSFSNVIKSLNLSNNHLLGPPYWVWSESPSELALLDLSSNPNVTSALEDDYFNELLQLTTSVTNLKMYNCRLNQFKRLIGTFPKAKVLELGISDYGRLSPNNIKNLPFIGLDKCCDIERLNLSNTSIYNIDSNVDMYTKLVEINLSQNYLNSLPNEFCHLENLEVCILSCNNILYLPENIINLKKLVCLCLDTNELCMLPDRFCELSNLRILDLYNNNLYEVPEELTVEEIDIAQNYLEEPDDAGYLEKRERRRRNIEGRFNGRKQEVERPEMEDSSSETDDEELMKYLNANKDSQDNQPETADPPSSPEDWDSDAHWVPTNHGLTTSPHHVRWLYFIKRKMEEGNFCPMDAHTVSVADMVNYENAINPRVWSEVEGQFDDYED